MFGKINKVLLGAALIGGIMSGSCMSSDLKWTDMDSVRTSCRTTLFTPTTLQEKIEECKSTADSKYLAVALLYKAHSLISYQDEISGQTLSQEIKNLVNTLIPGDDSTYNTRYAEVLWKSQTIGYQGLTLKEGWFSCVVQKAETLLEFCNTPNSNLLLNSIREATNDL